jgi:sugar lactone lactonase YvrE
MTDPEGYRVLIFSPSGAYLNRFGRFGTDLNSLGLPNGLAFDAGGNLWLVDAGNHRVLKYPSIFGAAVVPAELPLGEAEEFGVSPTVEEPLPTEAAPTD